MATIVRAFRAGRCAMLAVAAGACSTGLPVPDRPAPIAWADTLPITEPAEREVNEVPRIIRTALSGEMANVLGLRAITGEHHEALNVDAFDDVVNSAWFVHRNARDRMTPGQVRAGPTTSEGPAEGPLTIVAAKVEGISPGYTIRDDRGDRYVIKFDPRGFLYLSSGAGVISNRLLHAVGFNVPEDYIFEFSTDRLEVDPEATVTGEDFVERPLTLQVAQDALARTEPLPDGRYVAVASKFVPGPPKGPFFFEGTRADDPNDHYPHEHRRELRGLYVVSAWINHVDMRFMNTMDAYVPPGFLRHYLIDFAATLGSGTIRPHQPREGQEYNFDIWDTLGRAFTLGFHRAGWENMEFAPIHPTIGWLSAEQFDPAQWKPNWPNRAFQNTTARDAYWGAKLVGSFDREQVSAAVAAGGLPDTWAADTLTTILMTRRDGIVRHFYAKVSPIENPAVGINGGAALLHFDDFGLRDGPWSDDETRYAWRFSDPVTGVAAEGIGTAATTGFRQVVSLPGLAGDPDRSRGADEPYSTVRITVLRDGEPAPRPAIVYLSWSGESFEVVGLEH